MRPRTYILFVVLLCLLALCTVHEAVSQTRAKYGIARLLTEEEKLQQDLARMRAELATLMSPQRLERMNQEMNLQMVPLLSADEVESGGSFACRDE